jgi:hypothetical protein
VIRAGTRSLSDVAGQNADLVLRGVFHVSPPALGGLSIDGKLTFSNDAYLKLPTEWIMLHGELAIGSVAAPLAPRLLRCGRHHEVNQERDNRPQNPQGRIAARPTQPVVRSFGRTGQLRLEIDVAIGVMTLHRLAADA